MLYLNIAGVVMSYWIISISMVFINKALVGGKYSTVDVSLFVAWIQCIVTVVFILTIYFVKRLFGKSETIVYSALLNRDVLLMTFTLMGMLSLNNKCLRYVGVAFYQVAKSTTLIFVVVLSIAMLGQKISLKIFVACLIVAAGFILGVDQESLGKDFSLIGVVYGTVSSGICALNGVMTKKALSAVEENSVQLTLFTNAGASIVFIPVILADHQISAVVASSLITSYTFWLGLIVSGVFSFSIAWISAVQINLTSPVTHHISATCKSIIQTVLAVAYYREDKTMLWWASVVLVVFGAMIYAYFKILESNKGAEGEKSGPIKVI